MLKDLTRPQESIWITEQYYKGSNINTICGTAKIEEKIDFEKLSESIKIVCQKHDNFKIKIKIEDGQPKQEISKIREVKIETIEISNEEELNQRRLEILKKPFKIENNLLFKFYIFKNITNGQGAFMLNIHHLISDAWTLGFICNEIIKTYSKLKQNKEIETKSIYSYIDYIQAEKEYEKSEKYQKDKKYWEDKFQVIPEIASIPGSKKDSNEENNPSGERKQYKIEKIHVEQLKQYCQKNKISLYNFFMAVYSIYIGEISSLKEFVIGTPILNRTNFKEKNSAGMFINVVPFKINIDENVEFQAFIKNIAIDSLNMLKHQKYSYQSLLEELRKKDKNIPNLYNILLSYQITNAQQNEENIKYTTEWTFNGCCAENLDIQVYDINDSGNLNIAYDYKKSKYNEKDIENLHKRILNIIHQVLSKENIKIKEIDIVTPEEKEKIIKEFNNTQLEYNKNETVIDLFEKQVRENPEKVALISNGKKLTYKELNEKANILAEKMIETGTKKEDVVGIMLQRSPEMIIGLIAILKCGATYLPIDSEYPLDRILYMIDNSETKTILVNSKTEKYIPEKCTTINIEEIEFEKYQNIENIQIKNKIKNPAYLIYTSGSTGKPKGVIVTNQNLINFIYGMKQLIDFNPNKTMVSVTTICFDIFGLEMWCSLTSGLTLVVANEEEQNSPVLLNKLCLENNVNIIQTTPSRYSVIFEDKNNIKFTKNLTDILIGGEAVNNKILSEIKKATKCKIFNMYGPTETTIWSTVKELTNEKEITIGKPIVNTQCYILNKNHKILPLGIPGELYIGGDGVSNGYLKRDDLNTEKFIDNKFSNNGKIYNTNDLAYYKENGEIVHLGRTDFQVKIRGFRVELGEIENIIETNENVNQAVVIKKKLRNGHDALIGYYTANIEEKLDKEIKKKLEKELPQYMVPQYLIKLEKMPYTPNGKIDRKALPEPDIQNNKKEIIQARDRIDEELIEMIEKMLQIQNVSINDKILELGGDSLTAITLSTKILSKFEVQISIKDILSDYTIKEIANYIRENQFKEHKKIKIKKVKKQEYYPLSSAQRRIYYNVKMIGEENTVYNMPGAILVDEILDKNKVQKVFERIFNRHSTLRTYFVIENNEVVQKIEDKINFEIPIYQNTEKELKNIINNFAKPFKLEKAPLIRIEIHYLDNKKTLVLLDTHHIIMDGTSLNNLIIEFNRLYNGEDLKNIPIQYKDYAVWENEYDNSELIKIPENYWVNKFKDCEFAQLNLPYDFSIPSKRSYNGEKITKKINEKEFKKIERYAKKIGVSPYMFFVSTFFILLYKYTGQNDINVGSPIANRNRNETKRMIGMFVNNIILRGKINEEATFEEFLENIKNQLLEDLTYQPYPFDMLIKKLKVEIDNSKNPLFDVMFTYQNKEENIVKINEKETQVIEINNNISKFNLSLEVKPKTNTINIEYCTDLFKRQTIERLFEHYMNTIKSVMNDINIKIKDINIVPKDEKNKILYEFNNTKLDYPKNKIITELFEEQVEKQPDKTAVVFGKESISYKELNEKSNQIANYLRKTGVKPNDIIGVMLPRSIELIHTLIGVIKSGACYIPIDPEYPEQRIQYMLENSNAKILITNNELYDKIEYKNKVSVDYDNTEIYSQNIKNLKIINKSSDLAYVIYTSGSTGKPKGVKITNKNLCNFITGIKKEIPFKENKTMVSVTTICFDIFGLELWGTLTSGMKMVLANEEEQHISALLNELCIKNKVNMIQTTPSRYSLIFEESENVEFLKNVTDILVGGEAVTESIVSKMKQYSNARIFDVYGPTETTIWSTIKELTNEEKINIGRPIANTQVYVLDKELQVVPIGIAGELYIAGDGVGNGYLNRDDLTAERYIKNPYIENSIMYKTGDICKFLENGELYYLGREDGQVKVRGLRIELEEIEKKILDIPGIQKAKVIKQTIGNREIISAYFVANKRIRIKELREYLHENLPQYMIPSYFTPLDKFPYTPNGKIDKNKLPVPNGILQTEKKEYVKPKTDIEIRLTNIWEDILNTKPIGIKDNFFELGGDSILAMNLNVKLLQITDKIKYADIFAYPTIEELAEKIQTNKTIEKQDLDKLKTEYNDILNNNMIIPKETQNNEVRNILLTGVTGYLGIHILDELLKRETGIIYTLIRKEPGMTIEQKLLNKMHYYFGEKYDKYLGDRIRVLQGDITKDGFGLQQKELFELGNEVTTIINSAAKVSHYGNYLEFYNTNVKSVEKLIDFANIFKCKIYHISTLSISGNSLVDQYYMEQKFKEEVEFCENNFYIEQDLENVYVKTKFEAERKMLEAIKDGTDGYILRMGNLMPRLSDGKFQDNIGDNAYINRLKALLKIGAVPKYLINGYLEFTPIDSSSEAIVKIIEHTNSQNRIYHLFNSNHVTISKFLEIIKKLGTDIEIIDNEEFKEKLKKLIKSANSEIVNVLINDMDKDLNLHYESNVKLNSEHTKKLLNLYGFKWPKIDEKYIEIILNLVKGETNDSK